jgi:hypothetical protein
VLPPKNRGVLLPLLGLWGLVLREHKSQGGNKILRWKIKEIRKRTNRSSFHVFDFHLSPFQRMCCPEELGWDILRPLAAVAGMAWGTLSPSFKCSRDWAESQEVGDVPATSWATLLTSGPLVSLLSLVLVTTLSSQTQGLLWSGSTCSHSLQLTHS